jgi:hypothetical protein
VSDYQITFDGGPCNGTDRMITQGQLDRGSITCQGVVYTLDKNSTSQEVIVFSTAQAAKQHAQENRAFSTTAASQAYRRVARALGHTAPQELRRLERHTARLRRIAR